MTLRLVVAPPVVAGWPQAARPYHYDVLTPPTDQHDWLGLTEDSLPVGLAADWAVLPNCGAMVLFSGTARDHAPGRDGVEQLEYEAYEEHVGRVQIPRYSLQDLSYFNISSLPWKRVDVSDQRSRLLTLTHTHTLSLSL